MLPVSCWTSVTGVFRVTICRNVAVLILRFIYTAYLSLSKLVNYNLFKPNLNYDPLSFLLKICLLKVHQILELYKFCLNFFLIL